MADTKTSGLTALTGASLAAADLVAVVDVSDTTLAATGTDKRMTVTELVAGLGANGVATDAELAAHEADTTSVHGIADTSTLYRAAGTDVAVADGGTGASTAADARTNLGLAAIAASGSASDLSAGTVPSARLGTGGAGAGGKVLADNQTFIDLPAAGVGGSTGSVSDYVLCSSGTGGTTLKACNAATVLDAPLTINVDNGSDGGRLTIQRKDIPSRGIYFQTDHIGTGSGYPDLQLLPGNGYAWVYVNCYGLKLRTSVLGGSVYLESTARASEFKVSDGASGLGSAWIGGARWGVTTKTANYTATQFDYVILVDATAGAVTITLPAIATANRGQEIRVKKIDSSGNAVTIGRTGADTIDGATTSTLATQYLSRDFVAPDSGVDWAAF